MRLINRLLSLTLLKGYITLAALKKSFVGWSSLGTKHMHLNIKKKKIIIITEKY